MGRKNTQIEKSNPWLKWIMIGGVCFFLGFTIINLLKPLVTSNPSSDLYEYVRCENPNCKTLHPRLKSRNNTELNNSKTKETELVVKKPVSVKKPK